MTSPNTTDDANRWAPLLELATPGGHYEERLGRRNAQAAGSLMGAETMLAGFDDALSAVSILRGPADARPFVSPMSRVVTRVGDIVEPDGAGVATNAVLDLLTTISISELIGVPLAGSRLDLDAMFTKFLVERQLRKAEKIDVALLALNLGRFDEVRGLFGKIDPAKAKQPPTGDPVDLVKAITVALKSESGKKALVPAWDAFLRRVPALLAADEVQWTAVLLAAGLVLGKVGGMPIDQIAEAVHRRVLVLAAGSST